MNVLFAHDHKFYRTQDGTVYSSGSLNRGIWRRYLGVFDRITVVARVQDIQTEPNSRWDIASSSGVRFAAVESMSQVWPLSQRRTSQRAIAALVEQHDAVIARLPSEIGGSAARAARDLGIPFAVEAVGCAWDGLRSHGSVAAKVYAPLAFHRARVLIRDAPFVLYVTDRFLQARYPTTGRSVACSNVDLPAPHAGILERRLRRIANKEGTTVVGLIGSLNSSQKGIDVALRAVANVARAGIGVELRLLGRGQPGRWERYARRLGIDSLLSISSLPAGEPVLEWLDEVDVYLQPSFQEGLPRALIEAMSRGCPCLGSRVGGIPELLGGTCLHKPGDSEALSRLISRAVLDRTWQAQQASRNFHVAKRYSNVELDARRKAFWEEFRAYVGDAHWRVHHG